MRIPLPLRSMHPQTLPSDEPPACKRNIAISHSRVRMPSGIKAFKKAKFATMPPRTKKARKAKSSAMTSTLRCFQVLELLAEEPFELIYLTSQGSCPCREPRSIDYAPLWLKVALSNTFPSIKRYRLTPKSLWVGSGYLRHSAIYRADFFPLRHWPSRFPAPLSSACFLRQRFYLSIQLVIPDPWTRLRMWAYRDPFMLQPPASCFWCVCRWTR